MRHGTTKWMAAGAMGIALALAGCGGGGGSAMTEPDPTLQEMCEDDGGRYNADMSCHVGCGIGRRGRGERDHRCYCRCQGCG